MQLFFSYAAADDQLPIGRPQPLASGSLAFLNFHPNDAQYARAVSKAFRERGLRARFAAFEDDKVQNEITNADIPGVFGNGTTIDFARVSLLECVRLARDADAIIPDAQDIVKFEELEAGALM